MEWTIALHFEPAIEPDTGWCSITKFSVPRSRSNDESFTICFVILCLAINELSGNWSWIGFVQACVHNNFYSGLIILRCYN